MFALTEYTKPPRQNQQEVEQQYLFTCFSLWVLVYEGNSAQMLNILDCVHSSSAHLQLF